MYNRYKGNSGKVVRVEETPTPARKPVPVKRQPPAPKPVSPFQNIIPKTLTELETEDLLLILILYLMYRESGDKELLIIMGAMYLL